MAMTISGSNGVTYPDGTSQASGSQACKAWVNFNGTGTVAIRASYNVTSITDNNTGAYTVNFTTPISDANYSANVSCSNVSGTSTWGIVAINTAYGGAGSAPTTTAFNFVCITNSASGYLDVNYLSVAIFR